MGCAPFRWSINLVKKKLTAEGSLPMFLFSFRFFFVYFWLWIGLLHSIVIFTKTFGFFLWIFQVKYSEEQGIPPDNSARLLMFYGLGSCIARLLAGCVCNIRWVNPHFVFQVGSCVGGVSVLLFTVARSYLSFALCSVSFGLGNGSVVTTSNLIFLTCVDAKRRASAFGLANCLTSFVIASAPPFAGKFTLTMRLNDHCSYRPFSVLTTEGINY